MNVKHLFTILFGIFIFNFSALKAQELFKIGKKSATLEEFKEVYLKNNPKATWKKEEVLEYLELFKVFQLKKMEAIAQKLDTNSQLKLEYDQYVEQLVKSSFADKTYQEKLTQTILERSKYDIKVSHILIKIPKLDNLSDTLQYFQKISDIRAKIRTEEDFSKAAKEYSEDLNSKENMGSIGFVNVFMTFPSFEDAAYNTPIGQVSPIVKSPNGYHILMPLQKRSERGTVKVAHIYCQDQTEDDKKQKRSETKITQAYQDLTKNKISFDKVVGKYSDDRATISKGGELPEFGVNQMVIEFEEACFSLQNIGEISKPFQSSFGWHIVKLLEKKKPISDDEKRRNIKLKLEKDERMSNLLDITMQKIAKKVDFKETISNSSDIFVSLPDTFFAAKNWKLPTNSQKELFQIASIKYTEKDFANYIQTNFSSGISNSKKQILPTLYQSFKDHKLIQAAKLVLIKEDPQFRSTIQEYQDGLMIFELMEKEVWQKSLKDTQGIKEYYQSNLSKYQYDTRAKVSSFHTLNSNLAAQIYKEVTTNQKSFAAVYSTLKKTKDSSSFYLLEKTFEKGENPILSTIEWEEGKILPLQKNNENYYIILKINQILPPSTKPFNEVRGRVSNEYQKVLESKWIDKLKSKYPIIINQSNLDAIIN